MKPMSDRVFFDTNILVYAHTDLNIAKQSTAQALIINSPSFISTQVIQELANTLYRKFKHPWKDVEKKSLRILFKRIPCTSIVSRRYGCCRNSKHWEPGSKVLLPDRKRQDTKE